MRLYDNNGKYEDGYVLLSNQEEHNLAKSVMNVLSLESTSGSLYRILDRIFEKKTKHGNDIKFSELLEMTELYDFYQLEMPDIKLDGEFISVDLPSNGPIGEKKKSQRDWSRRSIQLIWHSVWDEHPGIESVASKYQTFPEFLTPIDERQDLAKQIELEEKFWNEVSRIGVEYACNKHEAYLVVKDYMRRGITEE